MQLGDARKGKLADNITGFGRALRRAGVRMDSARIALAAEAAQLVGLGSKQDAHSKFTDPLFVSVNVPVDLRIQTGSPAIDSGDPSFVLGVSETDFAGNPRKNGTAVDVGAYEK